MRREWARRGRLLPPVVVVVVLIGTWQLVAVHNPYVLPRPWAVATELADHPGLFVHGGRVTLVEALVGLLIGFAGAVGLAVVMAQIRVVERAVYPVAVVANVVPVVAVAPALVVAFGFGATPKVLISATICFFPTLVNAITGLRAADPAVLEVMASLRASPLEILIRVRLPSSLPYLFAAARVGLPLSVTGAVVAELVAQGSTSGLGTVIGQSAANAALPRVYAAIACLGVLGVALTAIVAFVERRVLSWHPVTAIRR